MDELLKIPPVTRSMLGGILVVTLPVLLKIVDPYLFLLWWPAVLRRWQLWRPLTAFLFGGGGLQLLFDCFLLFRNSMDLEINTFYRRTSEYVWALIITGSLIIATNYPLRSTVLFSPMLNALTYLWARSNPHSRVSIFGIITCPAPYLPYAYLLLDLVRGGPSLAIQSATGLLSAHIYYYLKDVLPASNGGRGPRYIPPPPQFLQRLFPDSQDPATAHQQPQPGGAVRSTGWGGTAFAPSGRSFGDGQRDSSSLSTGRTLDSSESSRSGWMPSLFRPRSSTSAVTSSRASGPDREAMLAAAEARLRIQRETTIAGRNAAASALASQAANSSEARAREASRMSSEHQNKAPASASQAGTVLDGQEGESKASGYSGDGSASERANVRSRAGGAGSQPFKSSPSNRSFSFGKEASSGRPQEDEEQETASGSGGRVAEIRRAQRSGSPSSETNGQDEKHDWGSGRKLGDSQ